MYKWTTLAESTSAICDEVNASKVVCVIGPPNIGKSTIIDRVVDRLNLDFDTQVCHLDYISDIRYPVGAVSGSLSAWWYADPSQVGDKVVLIEGNPTNKEELFRRVDEIAGSRDVIAFILVPEPILHYAGCGLLLRQQLRHPDLYDPSWFSVAQDILKETPEQTWKRDLRDAKVSANFVRLGLGNVHVGRGDRSVKLVKVCFEAGLHVLDLFASTLKDLMGKRLTDFDDEAGSSVEPTNEGGVSC